MRNLNDGPYVTSLIERLKSCLKRDRQVPTDLYFNLAACGVDVEELIEREADALGISTEEEPSSDWVCPHDVEGCIRNCGSYGCYN